MKLKFIISTILVALFSMVNAQNVIKGKIIDAANGDPLIGANVIVKESTDGNITDYDGYFEVSTSSDFPLTLVVSYLGYIEKEIQVANEDNITVALEENSVTVDVVEVKASRISEENKKSPLTIEALDNIAIKETPSTDFYSGLGSLKGVDLTAASLGFKVVNTRGFNSTSPVRSLQIIDGVDNQAPGLNFSLGNFLGSSELDVNKVEIIVGASSAFYGPNAFNGVISMETKDPFFHEGLSASIKAGERNLLKGAIRWADVINNKKGEKLFAYKINLEHLRANDWEADNYGPIDGSEVSASNPGRFNAVNIYGDEYQTGNDYREFGISQFPGLGVWYRTGYREIDLVDYDTRNYKANLSLHLKTKPSLDYESPELIFTSSYGGGTTVYQGDNRFSLRNITFLQNKLEYRKLNKFFIRAYTTTTTAGDSYDPYFTALELINRGKEDRDWTQAYVDYWLNTVKPQINESGFPQVEVTFDPITGQPIINFDIEAANQWIEDNQGNLTQWHSESEANANSASADGMSPGFFQPGTPEFQENFDDITGKLRSEGGTKFHDQSSLYHIHGEYKITPSFTDEITIGANGRLYTPESKGTIFSDSISSITNHEFGIYTGFSKSIIANKLKLQGALRMDKNQNFNALFSPAASLVFTPSDKDFLRVSFSSAIRNPTLTDQYLHLDVGRAILSGNLNGVDSIVTLESLDNFFTTQNGDTLEYFNIDPVRPENVKTFEVGYRTTLFEKLYVDAGYYYSIYDNFLGYNIGVDFEFTTETGPVTVQRAQAYRYSANSKNQVTTQGLAIGLNYFFADKFAIAGNYSFNKLNTEIEDDPIIPAFNTPEHKFNIGINGRDFSLLGLDHLGFNINYKWIEGFLFEGSPQFTGNIPTYDMLDAQVNIYIPSAKTTLKVGASNLLNNEAFQTYGGPRIGRLAYVQLSYDMNGK